MGGGGSDILRGGNGDDALYGHGDNDLLYGEDGNDILSGNEGNDNLFGGFGADTLLGGAGLDYLVGGSGNDQLTGGAGADRFVWGGAGFGRDTITDLEVSDKLDMRWTATTYADLIFTQTANGLEITSTLFDAGDAIIIANESGTSLSEDYFMF